MLNDSFQLHSNFTPSKLPRYRERNVVRQLIDLSINGCTKTYRRCAKSCSMMETVFCSPLMAWYQMVWPTARKAQPVHAKSVRWPTARITSVSWLTMINHLKQINLLTIVINKRRYPAYSHWSIMKFRHHQPLPSSTIQSFNHSTIHRHGSPFTSTTCVKRNAMASRHEGVLAPLSFQVSCSGPRLAGPGHWPFRESYRRCQELPGVGH